LPDDGFVAIEVERLEVLGESFAQPRRHAAVVGVNQKMRQLVLKGTARLG
jgi:hypothetical protein